MPTQRLPQPDPNGALTPPPPRGRRWRAIQLLLAAITLWFVGEAIVHQWREYRAAPIRVELRWPYVLLSGVLVLATYVLLIETWRRILAAWQSTLRFRDAARIWCVSNLGRYLPGKIWQILAMGKMAQEVAVPPTAAAGSALLNALVNVAVGLAVAVVAGFRGLSTILHGHASAAIGVTVAAAGGVLALPFMAKPLTHAARRVTGRAVAIESLPARAVYIAIAGNIVAWVLYGASFQLLVAGVLGRAPGSLPDYIAAYALSYVIGYLAFFAPAGAVVRETVQTAALTTLVPLINVKEAVIVALVSRFWLTILEVIPGLFFLARGAATHRRDLQSPSSAPNGTSR